MAIMPGDTSSGLPQEHEDQMQLGVRIITSAFQNKMHALQHEISGLRLTSEEQRQSVTAVQKKNSALEVELVEVHQRSQQLSQENKELFQTVQTLRKQIGRLEGLKQAVLSSIQDDQAQEAEIGDSRALMNDEYLRGGAPLTAEALGYPGNSAAPRALGSHLQQPPGAVPSQQSQLTTQMSFDQPPAQSAYLDNSYSQSQAMLDAQQTPAIAGSPVIDGKQFFRQARSRLSYESFNLFLASIKRLNNQQQSREETLEEARRIFGTELTDLYKDFETLLNRHGM